MATVTTTPKAPAPASAPARLRTLLIVLVTGCLAWGVVAGWTVSQHASAAGDVVGTSEPLSLDARQLYRSLSDADITATTAFLSGVQERLAMRQRYAADISGAAADLAALKAADSRAQAASLSAIAAGLPLYTDYVARAVTWNSAGYQSPGASFMQNASVEMHLVLLPAARSIYAQESAQLRASSAQATGLPWIVVALVLALVIGYVLLRTQRWVSLRTHRVVNYGLLGATVVLLVGVIWLVAAFAVARGDLSKGVNHGSAPAETLAQADIAAAQARGDEVLNLISRSGDTSFEQDFAKVRAELGPGHGTLLSTAAASSSGEPGARWVAAAGRDARTWYAVNQHLYSLDLAANYAKETQLVVQSAPGSSAPEFSSLERDLGRAITADQVVFSSAASAGRDAFGGLEAGIIVVALLMAAGCAWGLSRRLAEYR
jgi:hypothetical protein